MQPYIRVYPAFTPQQTINAGTVADDLTVLRDVTDDLPADVIGEAVALCIKRTWNAGFDPVEVTFVIECRARMTKPVTKAAA